MKTVSAGKKLVEPIVEECTETVEEAKIAENENKNTHKYNSCTLYIVLFSILFTIKVGIGTYFAYFHWYLKKMILPLKQQFTKLINGRSQTNWDQKSNLLLLEQYYQSQKFWIKLVKN